MIDFPLQARDPSHKYNLLPTLLPNFSPSFANNGLHMTAPSEFPSETQSVRVASTGSISVSGTTTAGSGTLSFSNPIFGEAPIEITVETLAGGDAGYIVDTFVNAINASEALSGFFFQAQPIPAVGGSTSLQVSQPSGVGNFTQISWAPGTTSASVSSIVQPSGGSGAIVPLNNFNFSHNNSMTPFWFGIPRDVGPVLLSELVTQGMPIV